MIFIIVVHTRMGPKPTVPHGGARNNRKRKLPRQSRTTKERPLICLAGSAMAQIKNLQHLSIPAALLQSVWFALEITLLYANARGRKTAAAAALDAGPKPAEAAGSGRRGTGDYAPGRQNRSVQPPPPKPKPKPCLGQQTGSTAAVFFNTRPSHQSVNKMLL